MRIVTYRVSTLDQNPALAREELHAAAARLGGEVVRYAVILGERQHSERPPRTQACHGGRAARVDRRCALLEARPLRAERARRAHSGAEPSTSTAFKRLGGWSAGVTELLR
jgi:hypothetical protein